MHLAGVAIVTILIIVGVLAFAFTLNRTYIDKRESNVFITVISTIAVATTLLCVMIVPVDIYIVSSGLNSDGSQTDPHLVKQSADAIQSIYYGLYILLLVNSFMTIPFAYFYFESDDGEASTSSRIWTALKYTAGFIIFFGVLMVLGIVLRRSKSDDTSSWKNRLSNDFTGAEAILSFSVGCLAVIGLIAYVVYASYGLARLPLKLMSRTKAAEPTLLGNDNSPALTGLLASHRRREERQAQIALAEAGDIDASIRRNTENISYLTSQYDQSGRTWTTGDKKQLDDLKREQRRLQSLRQSKIRRAGGSTSTNRIASSSNSNISNASDELTCWDKFWNFIGPMRILIAIPLLLVSLLLMTSVIISVVDKFKHSECGAGCGYTLGKTEIKNPLDEAFKAMAKVFPIDCLFFGGLVMYIFIASVSGVVGLGVRIAVWKLFSIQKGHTAPNAYLLAAWLLQLIALVLNMEILTIAPTYATFGQQTYLNTTTGESVSCDTSMIGLIPDTCIETQIGRFINTMSVETPAFTVILFYGNLIFILFYIIFVLHGVFLADNSKKEEVDAFRRLDDLSD